MSVTSSLETLTVHGLGRVAEPYRDIVPPTRIATVGPALEGARKVDGRDDVPIRLGNTAKTMNGEGFK